MMLTVLLVKVLFPFPVLSWIALILSLVCWSSRMTILIAVSGTSGKEYGAVGGYIAGSKEFVDMISSYAPELIITTSLPPATVIGAKANVVYQLNYLGGSQLKQINVQEVKRHFAELDVPVVLLLVAIIACSSIIQLLLMARNVDLDKTHWSKSSCSHGSSSSWLCKSLTSTMTETFN